MHVKSITLKIYERILVEAKKNDTAEKLKPTTSTKKKLNKPKADAPESESRGEAGAILGNYAFANARWGVPPEVNTKVEDKLEDELTTHFVNNKSMSNKSGQALKTSLENDWYEKFLSKPTQTNVYRGLRVSDEWMVTNVGKRWRDKFAKPRASYTTINGRETQGRLKIDNVVLHPKTDAVVTSLTNSIEMACQFAQAVYSAFGNIIVVCCAAVKDNPDQFIDSAAGLYDLPEISRFANEQEVLGIGSIKISHIILL